LAYARQETANKSPFLFSERAGGLAALLWNSSSVTSFDLRGQKKNKLKVNFIQLQINKSKMKNL
jgi:alpha-glucosidase (family GH31 glycosyl hydrolase)